MIGGWCGSSIINGVWNAGGGISSVKCEVCGKNWPLVVNAGQLDELPDRGVSTMFKMAEVFGLGFVCKKCMKKAEKK